MIIRIISGGQTGVDRAALDFAIKQHPLWRLGSQRAKDRGWDTPGEIQPSGDADSSIRQSNGKEHP